MIKKVSRKTALENYPYFPVLTNGGNKCYYPDIYNNYILQVQAKSTVGLRNNISAGLSKLFRLLFFEEMIFLGDSKLPWLLRDHTYKPAQGALNWLSQHKLSKSFNGALVVDGVELPDLLKQIFWLVRCNAVLFTPYFTNKDFDVLINICQYGNIHFCTLNKDIDELFHKVIANTGLFFLEGGKCIGYKIPNRVATNLSVVI